MLFKSHGSKSKQDKRIILATICISLSSQVNFEIDTYGFIISLAPLIMPIFLYFNRDLNPIKLMVAISFASPIFRGLLLLISNTDAQGTILLFILADIAFYFCYGLIYYFLFWRTDQRTNISFLFTIVICDYFSNILEIGLMNKFDGYNLPLFRNLFIVALVRGLISCLLVFLYHYFNLMLQKEEHEKRYYHFIWIDSSVKSEIYFMQKSITELERIMKKAYLLNKNLKEEATNIDNSNTALDIALSVHDLKRDYQNVIKSLDDYFSDTDNTKPMTFSEIIKLVTNYIQGIINKKHLGFFINVENSVEMTVPNHFYLVSILSNLIFNSLDATADKKHPYISIKSIESGENIIIDIIDNGDGIDQQTLKIIFQPGFTTKYNESTGNVYRGLGLSRVKTIVQEQFGGEIQVKSKINQGTEFKITLQKELLSKKRGNA